MNPYEATPYLSDEGFKPHYFRSTKYCLITMYSLCGIFGISQVVAYSNLTVHNVLSLLLAGVATCWANADVTTRGIRFHVILRVIYFLTWPLASLVYLIATRKFFGVGWWLLNAAAMYGTTAVLYYTSYFILFTIGRGDLVDPELFD